MKLDKKINLNIDLKDLAVLFKGKFLIRGLTGFCCKKIQFIALLIIILSSAYLVFIWYRYIFNSDWSEAKIQEYIQAKQSKKDNVFNRKKFEEVVSETLSRKAEFEKPLENMEDIFRLKK